MDDQIIRKLVEIEERLSRLEERVFKTQTQTNSSLDTVPTYAALPTSVGIGKVFLVKDTGQLAVYNGSWVLL